MIYHGWPTTGLNSSAIQLNSTQLNSKSFIASYLHGQYQYIHYIIWFMDNQNIRMLILYKHDRSKGSRKPLQVYEPLVWYTYEWLFIVKQGAEGVAMNSYTTEDSNISETYTCGFSECRNQHDTKQKWISIRFQQVFMILNSFRHYADFH